MLTSNQVLDMTPIGMIFHVIKSSSQTNGQSLEMEWQLLPNAKGTPVHIHPSAKESYNILEGVLEVNVNGKWRSLQQGEEFTVEAGTPHTFRNGVDRITRVYNVHSPALRIDEYFEGLSKVVDKFSDGNKKLKMDFNVATRLAMLVRKYRKEIITTDPPRHIVSMLNLIGTVRGLKL